MRSMEVPCASLVGVLQDDLVEVYLTGWNLLDADVRMQVTREIKVRRPKVLMMSPPWTWF